MEEKEKECENILMKKVAEYAGIEEDRILGKDLFLYVREQGHLAGAEKEMMVSPRLDDLECVYASLTGFLKAKPKEYVSVCAVFHNFHDIACSSSPLPLQARSSYKLLLYHILPC